VNVGPRDPPVEDHDGGVVAEVAAGGAQDRRAECVDQLAGMQVAGVAEGVGDVEVAGVAFQHAVGDEDDPITRLQRKCLDPERSACLQAEGQIDLEVDLLDPFVAQPQRRRVPGVDDDRRPEAQVDTQQLTGDELADPGVCGQRVVGVLGLVQEAQPAAATVAQAADQQGGQQRRLDLVPHRVGDRQLQRAAVEVVVEGVAADGAGRLEPAGKGELRVFTGVRRGKQSPLDLGGQREGRRALAPLEQISVPAVGDDHIGERVRCGGDIGDDLVVGVPRDDQFDHADRVAAVGHRNDQPRALRDVVDIHLLGPQDTVVGRTGQWDGLGLLRPPPAHAGSLRGPCAQADESATAEVRDQQAHCACPDHVGEFGGDDRGGVGRGSGFDALEQRAEVGSRAVMIAQVVTIS
jgi:hypothetical protein